ncbi:MAG: DeoR/GlpR family DNA-binding transcription regulator [Eubacteriales bacterium]|jgi:DeoR/GlpR family transcriptional regulator of sugar metabolism
MAMKNDRKEKILELLEQKKSVKTRELVKLFHVSSETVRRYLTEMEEENLIRRTHGGAVLVTEMGVEPDYDYRSVANYKQKISIGRAAADLVNDGDSIIIDLGTTSLEFAKFLGTKKDLTVFTNSLSIALELSNNTTADVYILGGKVRSGEGTISGYFAENMMSNFWVDKLFLGVGAICPDIGVMDYHIEETNLRRFFLRQAKQVIALCDYSKFGIKSLNLVCRTDELDYVITDEATNKKYIRELKEQGTNVIIVS